MSKLPLFFNHRGYIAGNGFLAHVAISGKCLRIVEEDGEVSFCGVKPGGVVGVGQTVAEARSEFLESIKLAVFDLAAEAVDFEDFKRRVEEFVGYASEAFRPDWDAAVADVRAGRSDDGEGMRRIRAETDAEVEVRFVQGDASRSAGVPLVLTPELNVPYEISQAA
ncbi:MAG: hypothetical protein IPJ17_01355 [Holophagales bacterium]|nr:MAG: hypothetical protein IPJ17_01355 [Holophagales bacterium]